MEHAENDICQCGARYGAHYSDKTRDNNCPNGIGTFSKIGGVPEFVQGVRYMDDCPCECGNTYQEHEFDREEDEGRPYCFADIDQTFRPFNAWHRETTSVN